MRFRGKFIFTLAVSAGALMSGCGGGGGGGHGSGGESARSVTMRGFSITEDRSLDDNLSGVWIEDSTSSYTARYSGYYSSVDKETGDESLKQVVTIVDDGAELYIRDCYEKATDIENGSKTLEFTIGTTHYVLEKHSNTFMSGTVDYSTDDDDFQIEGSGTVTLFKANQGPASRAAVLDSSLGMMRYSVKGVPEKILDVQCFSDISKTYTTETDGEKEGPNQSKQFSLRTFFDDSISVVEDHGQTYDHKSLWVEVGNSFFDAEVDEAGEYVNFNASGTDAITISIDANTDDYYYDASSDASSDAFHGTAELDF